MFKFKKYQGLGNDFILIDAREPTIPLDPYEPNSELIRSICDRHLGIGADGIIFVLPAENDGDIQMKIFNSDGNEAEMCGNGIRCLCKFIVDNNQMKSKESLKVETLAGIITSQLQEDGRILVDMGIPILDPICIPTKLLIGSCGLPQGTIQYENKEFEVASVGMGNPHVIVLVDNLDSIKLDVIGPYIEHHKFFPSATNVHFLEVVDCSNLRILVWERGSGATLACGTGACATLVAAKLLGLSSEKADIHLPGGILNISWPGRSEPVSMIGPAEYVFSGTLDELFRSK